MGSDTREIGMVGLGLMGSAMSTRLLAAGYAVHGYDVEAASRDAHLERGGTVADSPAAVAARCGLVILSLPNGPIMREVCLGPAGIAEGATQDLLVLDTTTSGADEATEVGQALRDRGVTYFDVGISGNSAMVARGDALGVVGGSLDGRPEIAQVLGAFCRKVMSAGSLGDGMRAKLVINHILCLNRFAVAEGLVHAEKVGMDLQTTLDIIRESAAYSRAMDMWGPRMVASEYLPPASRVRQGNKDLQLILDIGRESGAPMLAASQLNNVVRAMLQNGLGDADNAVIAEMLRRLAGIGRFSMPPSAGD